MRAKGAACVAGQGDGVAGAHILVGLDEKFAQVAVYGLQVVGVAEHDIVAVAAALVFGKAHPAVKCGADGVAGVGLEVDALVHAAEALAVSVGRGHVAGVGHVVAGDVNHRALGHGGIFVAIDILAFPALGVYVKLGLLLFGEERLEVFGGIVKLDGAGLGGDELAVLGSVLAGEAIVLCLGAESAGDGEKSCGEYLAGEFHWALRVVLFEERWL